MKSWTSIPFYLWKNTCRRWLEYPVSPCSKILIPSLLGVLAVIVLTLFSEIERELRDQLARNSAFTVYVSEFVAGDHAATILRRGDDEEVMWTRRNGADTIKQVRQPLVSAVWNHTQSIPLLAFSNASTDFVDVGGFDSPPAVWLLTNDVACHGQMEEISLSGKRTLAKGRAMPAWIGRELSMETAVAAPEEMMELFLRKGFINHTTASFKSIQDVERFVNDVSSYYRAEKRQVKIVSALGILKNLERITGVQRIVRTLIVMGCGIILSLTLGSIAWLEYRQDVYLLALLKSFGTSTVVLLIHMFLENLLLVLVGILVICLAWPPLYALAAPHLQAIGLHAAVMPTIPPGDVAIIVLACLAGVILAMVPVAVGLRKPAGLILQ